MSDARDRKRTLLVTGGSGFLGWNLCGRAVSTWDVVATSRAHPFQRDGIRTVSVDLTDHRELKELFASVKPSAVIHVAAASQPNYCQTHREESRRINVDATINIAGICADRGIPLAFSSTDLVFDGKHSPYSEDDPVSPVSFYAEQKVAAEIGIRDRWPSAAVCRMSLMFGDPGPHASSFIQPFLKLMRAGEELRLFMDEFRTPVSGTVASDGLLLAIEKTHGFLHLGGRERVSRHQFGLLLAERLGITSAKITACRQSDVPMAAPRPTDVALNSSRAFALGHNPPPLADQVDDLKGRV